MLIEQQCINVMTNNKIIKYNNMTIVIKITDLSSCVAAHWPCK